MSAWESPIIRVTTGQLNTVNDAVIGGEASIGGRSRYAGQLGKTLWVSPEQIGTMFSSTVGTLYGGRFRYVRFRSGAGERAPLAPGLLVFWDTTLPSWQALYQVTTNETLSSVDAAVMIAGVCISASTAGNYGFVQDVGMVPVRCRRTLTVAGAIGSRVYAAGAGAGADQAEADVLTDDALSLANARYLGTAVTAPANGGLSPVMLGFKNILG